MKGLHREDQCLDRPRHRVGLAGGHARNELRMAGDLEAAGLDCRHVGVVLVHQPHRMAGLPEMRADDPADRAGPDDGQLHAPDHRMRAARSLASVEGREEHAGGPC
jgi:hypothetical protein